MRESQGDWLPVRAALRPDGLYLQLRELAPGALADAFLHETVARLPGAERLQRLALDGPEASGAGPAPAGLVFHVARCGSTLVSQLLKAAGRATVYAEPQALNEILLPPHAVPAPVLVAALRALGAAFARHAGGPCVIKCSSWNALHAPLLAAAFPETPWALVVRDPLEVCASMLRAPPGWLREEEEPYRRLAPSLGLDGSSVPAEERLARAFAALCEGVGALDPARGRLLRYESLPAAAWEIAAPHFGIETGGAVRERMRAAAEFDAKSPAGRPRPFVPDGTAKRQSATPALRRAVATFAEPAFARLLGRIR